MVVALLVERSLPILENGSLNTIVDCIFEQLLLILPHCSEKTFASVGLRKGIMDVCTCSE